MRILTDECLSARFLSRYKQNTYNYLLTNNVNML